MNQYVVVDLEMCKVPYSNRKKEFHGANETIQIGAVLLNKKYEVVDEFNTYVRPEFGSLDWFITNLTGITSKDLKSAPTMREAMKAFIAWIPEDAFVVSWSDNDLKQIQKEAEAKLIEEERLESILATWIDCQKMFSERLEEERIFRLSEALIAADIIQEGHEHDGLVDAENTAKLFAKMMLEPEFKLNSYFESAHSESSDSLCFTMGDLFKNLQLA